MMSNFKGLLQSQNIKIFIQRCYSSSFCITKVRVWNIFLCSITCYMLNATMHTLLKGQFHEIFDPPFFRQTIPLGPLVHRLKPFENEFVFAKIFDCKNIYHLLSCCFIAVHKGLKFGESTLSYAKSTPRCAAKRRISTPCYAASRRVATPDCAV
jgi:hypothetical protein